MKIHPTASGKYNTHIRLGDTTKSITGKTIPEVERKVKKAFLEYDRKLKVGMTVGEAIDLYIESKENVLSPTTVALYENIRNKNCQNIMEIPLSRLTNMDIQREISRESATHKPKTVANMRGLLSAALGRQGFKVEVSVPQNPKKIIDLPEAEDVMKAVIGKDIELPALLAMWLSCSASEIRGIQVSSIKDGYVTIQESMVDVDGKPVSKQATKAYERTRKLRLPDYIMDLIKKTEAWQSGSGYIVTMNRRVLYSHFVKAIEDAGLPHMTFHQLRHMNASVMAMLGISDIYAMQRGGWKTRSVMQGVYQHVFEKQRIAVDDQIDNYFNQLLENVSNEEQDVSSETDLKQEFPN